MRQVVLLSGSISGWAQNVPPERAERRPHSEAGTDAACPSWPSMPGATTPRHRGSQRRPSRRSGAKHRPVNAPRNLMADIGGAWWLITGDCPGADVRLRPAAVSGRGRRLDERGSVERGYGWLRAGVWKTGGHPADGASGRTVPGPARSPGWLRQPRRLSRRRSPQAFTGDPLREAVAVFTAGTAPQPGPIGVGLTPTAQSSLHRPAPGRRPLARRREGGIRPVPPRGHHLPSHHPSGRACPPPVGTDIIRTGRVQVYALRRRQATATTAAQHGAHQQTNFPSFACPRKPATPSPSGPPGPPGPPGPGWPGWWPCALIHRPSRGCDGRGDSALVAGLKPSWVDSTRLRAAPRAVTDRWASPPVVGALPVGALADLVPVRHRPPRVHARRADQDAADPTGGGDGCARHSRPQSGTGRRRPGLAAPSWGVRTSGRVEPGQAAQAPQRIALDDVGTGERRFLRPGADPRVGGVWHPVRNRAGLQIAPGLRPLPMSGRAEPCRPPCRPVGRQSRLRRGRRMRCGRA